jgi:serpin B
VGVLRLLPKLRHIGILLITLATWHAVPTVTFAAAPDDDVKAIADGNNAFALDLYAQTAKENKGNFFFSPYSISSALAMTYAGARGQTAYQMRKALHFTLPDERVHVAYGTLSATLNSGGVFENQRSYELVVANALWGQRDYPYKPEFTDLLKNAYGADLHQVDFAGATEGARQEINQWVGKQTQEKIKSILEPRALDKLARLVLVNAIYFKSSWEKPFQPENTTDQPFHVGKRSNVFVPLMVSGQQIWGVENDDLQAVEINYLEAKLGMVILLPRTTDGLQSLEEKLTSENLNGWLSHFDRYDGVVYLPKFRVECKSDLVEGLAAVGLSDAFDSRRADFSGIASAERLHINHVFHNAFVEVDEAGTIAAAATAMGGTADVAFGPMTFRADHPFIFFIREESTGAILFAGRVVNPKQ